MFHHSIQPGPIGGNEANLAKRIVYVYMQYPWLTLFVPAIYADCTRSLPFITIVLLYEWGSNGVVGGGGKGVVFQ